MRHSHLDRLRSGWVLGNPPSLTLLQIPNRDPSNSLLTQILCIPLLLLLLLLCALPHLLLPPGVPGPVQEAHHIPGALRER
jgi:hypothetical protein